MINCFATSSLKLPHLHSLVTVMFVRKKWYCVLSSSGLLQVWVVPLFIGLIWSSHTYHPRFRSKFIILLSFMFWCWVEMDFLSLSCFRRQIVEVAIMITKLLVAIIQIHFRCDSSVSVLHWSVYHSSLRRLQRATITNKTLSSNLSQFIFPSIHNYDFWRQRMNKK